MLYAFHLGEIIQNPEKLLWPLASLKLNQTFWGSSAARQYKHRLVEHGFDPKRERQSYVQLLEQMQQFNRERIPERVVHAKGSGAHGTFTVTRAIPEHTKPGFCQKSASSKPRCFCASRRLLENPFV